MPKKGRITEKSLYPPIIDLIKSSGGTGINKVKYNSEPDIVFDLLGYQWLMSVKVGDTQKNN